jgi:two-component system, NtrC family, response regulator AtoC
MKNTVLIIEDDQHFASALSRLMRRLGFGSEWAASGEDGLKRFDEIQPDLILLDLGLPGMDGVETTRQIHARNPIAVCIVITGQATLEAAVSAMQAGAFDFISKAADINEIQFRILKAIEVSNLRQHVRYLTEQEPGPRELTGESKAMQLVFQKIREIAKTPFSSVLIAGETGTGKELVARAIHRLSDRADRPLVTVNCAAVPENLLESEFFGHERGAFTGAEKLKKGLFELAHGGLLFLDEVGELDLRLQAKLLRAIEQRRFMRVGGNVDIEVDTRIIAATNQDLEALVKRGAFRQDLYYRLNVFLIPLPPLRERESDVLLLAASFIREFNRQFGKQVTGLDEAAALAIRGYAFPGNVRQLRNAIEQAMILAKGMVLTVDQFPVLGKPVCPVAPADGKAIEISDALPLPEQLEALRRQEASLLEVERKIIHQALSACRGNKTKAAVLLKISRYALRRRIQRIESEGSEAGEEGQDA